MAKLKGLEFTGPMGGFSAYRIKNVEGIILRRKGGASKNKIKNDRCFERTRELNKEWEGCSKQGKAVRAAILPLRFIADYNFSGPINVVMKNIQVLDGKGLRGQRAIYVSEGKELLNGFSLTRQRLFESVVKNPVTYFIDRSQAAASLQLPALRPGLNLANGSKLPYFRFVAVLGVVSDLVYLDAGKCYRPVKASVHGKNCSVTTDWFSAYETFPGYQLNLGMEPGFDFGDSETFILGVGIEFGKLTSAATIEGVKYAGAAKLLLTA